MREIKELDQSVIDKIAAGEVVERPASVIKELTENAIDAGATAISVEIEGGGIDLIRVTDNGSGIPEDQIETAFLRHATSKLRTADELENIGSLGFRGEALSSIAAVSKVEVFTKTEDEFVGCHYIIEGGKEIDRESKATPDGTTFIVRALFYNTPARRKFLKSPATEGNYIRDLLEKLAISHPDIAFKFRMNKQEKFVTVGDGKLLDAVYCVYGRSIANHLIEIDSAIEGVHISGFLGKSELNRGNRTMEIFFVNRRLVKSSLLSKALEAGGEGFVMKHQYPFAIIFLDFDRPLVDVNVHPTKQEVRFLDEPLVYKLVSETVHRAYTGGDTDRDTEDLSAEALKQSDTANYAAKAPEPFEKKRLNAIKDAIVQQIADDSPYEKKYERSEVDRFIADQKTSMPKYEQTQKTSMPKYEQTSFISKESAINHRLIGLAFDTYWIFEYNDALFLVDQHAAHEKVNYERLMRQLKEREMTSEMVSPSIIITLTRQEKQTVFDHLDAFCDLGFRISDFGETEVALEAVPGNLLEIDPEELFTNVLKGIDDWGNEKVPEIVREKIATMSCKAAVKGGQPISPTEMDNLFMEMMQADEPYHCPHGRPTVVRITKAELDRRFKRIVN
ncbi:MAG: DNA mismatch repair endonuclease MutL [Lachnospiraceae bacterium]|uniref:DNA mismatch repair protein MutL n=1 Tax=Candidatus Weimeria bifida TaxID=2599074 RepID=A0A6N7IWK2_9FIRM|nr:DNA mismatch repair endonuclease MutL [Candidatus Weimeria bifida]RRF96045.1 MAG: DNA mismatch repair endonuclease MutL [Lachnospiraceae bacterium]